MAKLGKRTRAAREAFAGKENLTIEEAVALVKANATSKFDETIEIAVNLGVDTRHADQMVRGVITCTARMRTRRGRARTCITWSWIGARHRAGATLFPTSGVL